MLITYPIGSFGKSCLIQLKPICLGDNLAGEYQEDDQQDHPAAAAPAGGASAKPKAVLQPIEKPIQQE
jgi:hypothetical protein